MRRYVYLLLAVLIVLGQMALPYPVYAATSLLNIQGEGTDTVGTYFGGATDYTNLNTNDGDTTYLHIGGTLVRHCYDMTNYAAVGSITNVSLRTRARENINCACTLTNYVLVPGVAYHYGTQEATTNAYVTYITNWAVNPQTGLAWTAAEINAYEFGFRVNTGASPTYVTYMDVVVTYTPATAPTASTSAATSIGYNGTTCNATLNGSIDDDGGADIDMRGFVWSTTSNSTDPGDIAPPATYTGNWTEVSSDWGEGDFSYSSNFTCCETWYYRAYAHNSVGWDYGEEVAFDTLCTPDITTDAATYVTATTARLNSLVVDDGNQACDVRFAYGSISANCTDGDLCATGSCNSTSYNVTTAWVEDTYTTGQTPYLDVSGLVAGTTYYVCSQIRNDYACACGGEVSFTTETGINEPTTLEGITTATTASLAWVKGPGSTNTLIRYKLGGYPSGVLDGTEVYFDSETSVLQDGLTPGTTYYYMAWGESGGTYSSGNTTLMITTLAAVAGTDDLPVPATPSLWFSAPEYTNMEAMPFYPIVNFAADQFSMPRSTAWYLLAMCTCVGIGILCYSTIANHNLIICIFILAVCVMIGSFMKLIPMWHIVPVGILAAAGIFVGERR